jgi:hypothetical protein
MSVITTASRQWATRPADERFTSLLDMRSMMSARRLGSKEVTVGSKRIMAHPGEDQINQLLISGPNGRPYEPTHWAFGQLAGLAGAPAGYLRKLPAAMSADCLNWGLQKMRDVEDVKVLLNTGTTELAAATGPQYGRIWNSEILDALINRFGDGVTGDWRVPGEFGKRVQVNQDNTTLYAGDRDMFVFLADEDHRIENPGRRNGETGSLARGFYVWNSEVGSSTFGIAMFLFDYVCCNRMIWGAQDFREIKVRHTAGAPDRFIDEVQPILLTMAKSSPQPVEAMLAAAKASKLDDAEDWLSRRFSKSLAGSIMNAHLAEEGRPVETLWDAATGLTAHAKSIKWQDERVSLERDAGKILDLAL